MPTYNPLKRIILKINSQINELTIAKRVLESMNGGSKQHRAQAMMSTIESAMEVRRAVNGRDYKAERARRAARDAAERPKRQYKAGTHWTQTPAGRKKMAASMNRRLKEARAAGHKTIPANTD
jgi:hypothetical protein